MQVEVDDPTTGKRTWRDVSMIGSQPYMLDTREEAENMIRICYPSVMLGDHGRRVVEVDE